MLWKLWLNGASQLTAIINIYVTFLCDCVTLDLWIVQGEALVAERTEFGEMYLRSRAAQQSSLFVTLITQTTFVTVPLQYFKNCT